MSRDFYAADPDPYAEDYVDQLWDSIDVTDPGSRSTARDPQKESDMTEPTQEPRELGIEGVEIEPDENGRRRIRMPDGAICYPDETLAVGEMEVEAEKASEQELPREQGTTVNDQPKEN